MNSVALALLIAALVFTGGVAGMFVHRRLPDRLIPDNSRDLIKFVVGFTTTLSALVLSLLVASSYGLYNTQKAGLEILSARAVQLDRILRQFGPEAAPAREIVKNTLIRNDERIRHAESGNSNDLAVDKVAGIAEQFTTAVGALDANTDAKKRLLAKVYEIADSIGETRDLMSLQIASPVSAPLLAILTFWTTVLFFGYGLLSKINATVVTALAVGALVLGCAIFLIVELSQPYSGIIRVPTAALEAAIEAFDK